MNYIGISGLTLLLSQLHALLLPVLNADGFKPALLVSVLVGIYFFIKFSFNKSIALICCLASINLIFPIINLIQAPGSLLELATKELLDNTFGLRIISILVGFSQLRAADLYFKGIVINMVQNKEYWDRICSGFPDSIPLRNALESEDMRKLMVSHLDRPKSLLYPEVSELAKNHAHLDVTSIHQQIFHQYSIYLFSISLLWVFRLSGYTSLWFLLASWGLFFVCDDWLLISDYYYFLAGNVFPRHSLKILFFNLFVPLMCILGVWTSLGIGYACLAFLWFALLIELRYHGFEEGCLPQCKLLLFTLCSIIILLNFGIFACLLFYLLNGSLASRY